MKTFRKNLAIVLAMVMLLGVCGMISGCQNEEAPAGSTTPSTTPVQTQPPVAGNNETYSVNVQTEGGMVLAGLDVYVYADSSKTDLKQFGQTDENGNVSFQLPAGGDYVVELSGVPAGYALEPYYGFTANNAQIVAASSLVEGESLAGASLGLGSVMYDFSVTTPAGQTITLSEVLKEKDMVMLNFWYTTCTYCVAEFPFMQQAYEMYSDKIEIIALNPFEQDDAITAFQADMGLTFPMAACNPSWATAFGVAGYPTSIIVDRYGVVCMIEAGGITSLRPFTSAFEHFTGDDYEQVLCDGIGSLVSDIVPTVSMDTSENIAAVVNKGELDVTYRPETEGDSARLSWPFVITEKDGVSCLKASNQQIDGSFAILYADVYLKAGQAVGFDYMVSSESLCDILYVIVEDEDIYQISGEQIAEGWKGCYPYVALEDGYYEVALCYLKDESGNVGDDTVYIKDFRVVDVAEIDVETYIPRFAATSIDGFEYEYVDIVFNESDGYYHVGTADGPLLLADLMGYTQFNEESSIFELVYNGDVKVNGESYYDTIVPYFTLASNSALNGVCTVNKELADHLKLIASIAGFDGTENEWLKICKYYQVYGSGDKQLTDPIQGLDTFCALTATLGKNVETNVFFYNRVIIPRGLRARFVPQKSGVYRITSRSDYADGLEGWILDSNGEVIYTYEHDERMNTDDINVSMVYYMEAGESYYIDIAFWDLYHTGYIYYDIEYIAPSYKLFRLASPGYFTYDSDATGDAMYYTISGGIDVIQGEDGYYYEDLGLDANGKQIYGGKLYADFTGITGIFNTPISSYTDADGDLIKGLIDKGAFDFSKTENDLYILGFLEQNNFDTTATEEYLKAMWGEDFDAYALEYQLDDVFAGRYHGRGEDLTEEIKSYLDKVITTGSEELRGCVEVDGRLAEILQLLMEKYTFENVDCSWPKLCYYYDYLGPEV